MPDRPKFSILHTSARPDKWREVYYAWIAEAGHHSTDVEYILAIDIRWGFPEEPAQAKDLNDWEALRPGLNKCRWNEEPYAHSGYVLGVNLAARHSRGAILIVNADDQFPCEKWDMILSDPAGFLDGCLDEFVIRVSTGTVKEHERRITVMPILSRKLYERRGYVFYPEYESMFADNDFCEEMDATGVKIIHAEHLVFPHKHPLIPLETKIMSKGMMVKGWTVSKDEWDAEVKGWDAQYKAQHDQANYEAGRSILERRRAAGFHYMVPKQELAERAIPGSITESRKRFFAFALPGDTFSKEFVGMILKLQGYLTEIGWHSGTYMGYSPIVYHTRQNLLEALLQDPKPELILWLDYDNLLSVENLNLLMEDLERDPSLDSVAGWYWCAHPDGSTFSSVGVRDSQGHVGYAGHDIQAETELIGLKGELAWHGFGCVLMRRSCLEKAGDHPFLPIMIPESAMRMSGEDASFFINAEKGGAKFVVDPRVHVPHQKRGYIGEHQAPKKTPCIVATIRARNEAKNIARCIASVVPLCGEGAIELLDDHSTDDTVEIAERAGATIWRSPFDDRDEGRDRQFLLEVARKCGADWIFAIDADEALDPRDVETLRRACQYTDADALHLRWMNLWDSESQIRVDGIYSKGSPPRLWRVTPSLQLRSISNGVHCWSEREVKRGFVDVRLWHWGYMDREQRYARWRWYNEVDPNNEAEDCYRHQIQGDPHGPLPEAYLKKAGPLKLEPCKLPIELQTKVDGHIGLSWPESAEVKR